MRILEGRAGIGQPDFNLGSFYSGFYDGTVKSHVPNPARNSMLARTIPELEKLGASDLVLDLGSGRQIMERFLLRGQRRNVNTSCKFVTLDFADIKRAKLLEADHPSVIHIRADGALLPFRNNTFSVAFSDMAFELMGEAKYEELSRVMKPEGKIFINVLHEKAPQTQIPMYEERARESRNNKYRLRQWKKYWENYQVACQDFSQNPNLVKAKLEEHGLLVNRYEFNETALYDWVEIDAQKVSK